MPEEGEVQYLHFASKEDFYRHFIFGEKENDMGYKAFCDSCGQETAVNYAKRNMTIEHGKWEVSIEARHQDGKADQVLCVSCLSEIITYGTLKPVRTERTRNPFPVGD